MDVGNVRGRSSYPEADLFRGIGERLRIGIGKSGKQEGTPLDAIIYYAQRTADIDNFASACDGTTPVISLVVSPVVTFCSYLGFLTLNLLRVSIWIMAIMREISFEILERV